MFRSKKKVITHESELLLKNKSNILNSNDSSINEGTILKETIYHFKNKASPNIQILDNKILSNNIPSFIDSEKRNFDFKNDILIKEIIGNEKNLFTESNNKYRSLFNLDEDKKFDIELNDYSNKKKYIPNSYIKSRNNIKKNYFDKNGNALDLYIRGNIIKKFKRKYSLNKNKLKIFENNFNCYNTPKSDKKNRTERITINYIEKYKNDFQINYAMNNFYKNSSKSPLKNNKKNSIYIKIIQSQIKKI